MPDPQQQDDQIKAMAPDNSVHRFPKGTDPAVIDRVMKQYVLSKKAAPVAPQPAPQQAPQPKPQPTPEQLEANRHTSNDAWNAWVDSVRKGQNKAGSPWMADKTIADPHWYGRSGRYFGGEFIGDTEALAGMGTGGAKLLYDIGRAAVPVPFTQEQGAHPLQSEMKNLSQAGSDIAGIGKGALDLGQTIWDYVRHFPEAEADPVKFGKTIANTAMTVDGAVKLAHSTAGLFKVDSGEAAATANKLNNGAPSAFFKRKAFEDAYIHTKGIEVAKQISTASKAVHGEVEAHAQGIAKQIDTAIPSGVIDAGDEALKIIGEFKDVVKTPDTAHPILRQMVDDAQKTVPGQWTWEKVRQFRSSVGRAMGKVQGPQKAVMTRVYADLTTKLGDVAKKYNLGDSWSHYNELERKYSHQFADTIDNLRAAQSGQEVASILNKDKALTGELSKNLSKYGLNSADVTKFVKDSSRIAKQQKGWKGTLFRMATGTPMGVPAMLAVRATGGGWLSSVVAGAAVGYAATGLVNLVRALRLSPDVIEEMLNQRELPGRLPVGKGDFPQGLSTIPNLQRGPMPPPGGPQPTQGAPPQLPGMPPPQLGAPRPQLPAPLSQQADTPGGESELERLRRNPPMPTQEMSEAEKKAAEVRPKGGTPTVTKAAPGEVGREPGARPGTTRESRIGRNTKQAERVANKRAEALRGKQAEEAEATARARAKDVNVSHMQILECEEALKRLNPAGLTGLQKLRRLNRISDAEYLPALHEMILRAWEKGSQK
jgi:hypothetical protein